MRNRNELDAPLTREDFADHSSARRERKIAMKIALMTGESILTINTQAAAFVDQGLCETQKQALEHILSMIEEN